MAVSFLMSVFTHIAPFKDRRDRPVPPRLMQRFAKLVPELHCGDMISWVPITGALAFREPNLLAVVSFDDKAEQTTVS
jgi:hypothetical protein